MGYYVSNLYEFPNKANEKVILSIRRIRGFTSSGWLDRAIDRTMIQLPDYMAGVSFE